MGLGSGLVPVLAPGMLSSSTRPKTSNPWCSHSSMASSSMPRPHMRASGLASTSTSAAGNGASRCARWTTRQSVAVESCSVAGANTSPFRNAGRVSVSKPKAGSCRRAHSQLSTQLDSVAYVMRRGVGNSTCSTAFSAAAGEASAADGFGGGWRRRD